MRRFPWQNDGRCGTDMCRTFYFCRVGVIGGDFVSCDDEAPVFSRRRFMSFLSCRTLLFVFSSVFLFCGSRSVFFVLIVLFRAAVSLRQLSGLRLLLSFFRERKRTKKAFRGGVPPPQKLPLPRLGQAASRHRSSDAFVGHLKCGVRYSLQCSAHKTSEPLWVQTCFFSAPRMGTVCTARAAAREWD